jgi:hypothetical protein
MKNFNGINLKVHDQLNLVKIIPYPKKKKKKKKSLKFEIIIIIIIIRKEHSCRGRIDNLIFLSNYLPLQFPKKRVN